MANRRLPRQRRRAGTGEHQSHAQGQGHAHAVEHAPRRGAPRSTLYLVAALMAFGLVLAYDWTEVRHARGQVEQARQFAEAGNHEEAVRLYQTALDNRRLGHGQRAEIALALGNIHFEQYQEYAKAHEYYQRARASSGRVAERADEATQERMQAAQLAAAATAAVAISGAGGGHGTGARRNIVSAAAMAGPTSASVALPSVGLALPPADDLRGPVVAKYRGGAIHAGELARALRDLPASSQTALRENPVLIESIAHDVLNQALLHQAALDSQLYRDPDLVARVYDYQRAMLGERYTQSKRPQRPEATSTTLAEELHAGYDVQLNDRALLSVPDYISKRSPLSRIIQTTSDTLESSASNQLTVSSSR